MAYSKSKYVEAAQKLLNQGKVPQAIAEYQQILKYEPKDQVTLMTVGELYIRQGETFQAIDYFERLAQIFVGDGFLTKAIAVYKRIAKLAPEEIRPLEKLADLYVQQGVMSEARPLFLQLAEIHLKGNRQPEAVALLKKLLLAEPDNLRIQIRLADLYTAMGQKADAMEAYVSAAQRALARGDSAECEKLADRALKIDPKNMAAVIVKARIHSSKGDTAEAAKALEQVADLDKGGEQTELLLDLYLKNSDWEHAAELAVKVFDADPKNFGPAQKITDALLQADEGERAMEMLERIRVPMVDAGEHEHVGRLLNDLSARLPGRVEPLEWLVDFYGRTNDSFRLADALAHLGDALAGAKQYERAKEVYEQLVSRQPDSDSPKRKLNAVLRKLGHDVAEEAPAPRVEQEEEASLVELTRPAAPKLPTETEADAPEVRAKPAGDSGDAQLDDETQKFIAQSLTDVDLFASYGLTQKAIGLLEAILRRAPRHAPTLEKLLDFVLGAGDDRRTAELAAQLEQIHTERGDSRSAERFEELRRRFQRAAGMSDEELAPPQPAVPEPQSTIAEAAPVKAVVPEPTAVAKEPAKEEVHEVDLSDEWASMLSDTRAAAPVAKAPAAHEDAAPEFEIPMEAAEVENTNPFAEISADIPVAEGMPEISIRKEAHETASIFEKEQSPSATNEPLLRAEHSAPAKPPKEKPAAKEKPKPPEPEFEVDQEYELVLDAEPLVPAHEQKPPSPPPKPRKPEPLHQNAAPPSAAETFASDQFLADLANEIDQLGIGEPAQASAPSTPRAEAPVTGKNSSKPAPPRPPASSTIESGPLKDVFDEFRSELGEMGGEEEDLETHYNLGIAFREMGLLEEAISEFQKVAKGTDRGRPFPYVMQCCTFLGLCFMDKGQPGVAAIWYDRALHTPDLDPESVLALRYDLGVAQESAGEPSAALKSFSQVYAMNIDYRDVGERIAALQKPTR
jgi:tetratricopeptide (TPR) repeat protein